MDGVKKEENVILQSRAAESVAAFVEYCNSPLFTNTVNPCDKVIRNLFTFLCQDTTITPVFGTSVEGILSLKEDKPVAKKSGKQDVVEETEEQITSRITRRGALEALRALAKRFGPRLFSAVPRYWDGISLALTQSFDQSFDRQQADTRLETVPNGQDLVDCLTSLRLLSAELDTSLHPQLVSLFPFVIRALQSSYSVIRNVVSKSLAALCDVVTNDGMRMVVDEVVPLVGDATHATSRQGAVEAIHRECRIISQADEKTSSSCWISKRFHTSCS